ncbi:MAG: hypothetical protein ACXWID_04545 [Pyrinomonadaceae bacterium]
MEKSSVLELKNKILESLTERRGGVQMQVATIPRVESRLAVGYSQKSNGQYELELRVQSGKGAAYRKAQTFKELAKDEANIEIIPTIEIPAQSEVTPRAVFTRNARPLHIGLSISHEEGTAGTLGAFVSDERDRDCILSNNHVLALMNKGRNGDRIYQPGYPDQDPLENTDEIATVSKVLVISKTRRNLVDAALAVIGQDSQGNDLEHTGNQIPRGFGFPMQGKAIAEAASAEAMLESLRKDTAVCKIGRTTGFTEGSIGAVELDNVPVRTSLGIVYFDHVIQVNWQSNTEPFSEPGDSGSLVFTKNEGIAVGLHFAGGMRRVDGKELGVSYSCNISRVLGKLKASLV